MWQRCGAAHRVCFSANTISLDFVDVHFMFRVASIEHVVLGYPQITYRGIYNCEIDQTHYRWGNPAAGAILAR